MIVGERLISFDKIFDLWIERNSALLIQIRIMNT